MKKIFSFNSKCLSTTIQASAQNIVGDQDIDLLRGKYNSIQFPIIFKQRYGKNLKDILGTGFPSLYLISDKFKLVLEDNHLTGWKTYSIILIDKNGHEISGYHGFSITGTCDPKDYSQSKIIEKKYVEKGPFVKHYKGFKVIPHGDFDFFIPPHTVGFCISQKAALYLTKNKITNLELIDIEEEEVRCKTVNPNFQG